VTTGQYPRRRETDEEAAYRNELAEARRKVRLELAFPVPVPFRELLPYISASGRLVRR